MKIVLAVIITLLIAGLLWFAAPTTENTVFGSGYGYGYFIRGK